MADSTLKVKLNTIYQEKQNKIIPENIKKDVQIFDIIGTYELNYEEAGTISPEEYAEAQTQISDLFGEEASE